LEDGVLRSTNRGSPWVAWNFSLIDFHVLCLAFSPNYGDDETILIGTESGLFRSTNGGRSWSQLSFPTEFAPVLSLAFSPAYKTDEMLFAGTEAQGLAISRNGGETWERLGEDLPEEAINQIILSPLYPQKPMILLALTTGLVLSDDDGKTWTAWKSNPAFEAGITCLLAPQGLSEGASLLVGLADGQVLRV